MSEHGKATRSSARWRERATAWIDEQLPAVGAERTGEVQQPHLAPWATALRAPTTRGAVWLKAAGPGTAFEVPLYALLHRVAPQQVLTPLATDVERAWVLLPDGGPTLHDSLAGGALVDALAGVFAQYAELQRAVQPHVDDLVALGIADMRPAVMTERFEEALRAVRGRADAATYERLAGLRGDVAAWCDELAAAPGGATIDHNDLHPGNVFLYAKGRARFFDWGDAVLAHPFASMLVGLGWVRDHLPDAGDSDVDRLRDNYLEVWTDIAPRTELLEVLELATRLARITRSLIWDRAVRQAGDVPEALASAPLDWLSTLHTR